MIYLFLILLLFTFLLFYFRIADHYNIIDKPNSRSSHSEVTIRGGGIIFPLAMLLYLAFFHEVSYLLLAGMLLISLISFLDDIYTLSSKLRILVHLLAVTAMLYSMDAFAGWPLWLIPLGYVMIIGAVNVYNFMDGINGITGLYSLVILLSLLYVNSRVAFTDPSFIITAVLACLVFLFFNFRKKARCFAGDVGSVSIGFWIISLLIMLISTTNDLRYILFLAVYGVDAVLTIVHRLLLRQNIFEAHRLHFYQVMANERRMPHLLVTLIYGTLQLLLNVFIIFTDLNFGISFLLSVSPLVFLYVVLKPRLMVQPAI